MSKFPKIGIRPTIDGRQGGVRESLEEKTMNLARSVAKLITDNLRNIDGSPVECVIADTTIGRVGESAACAEKFEREGVGSTITVTSCWCYGAETMDMNPHWPKAVWGFNGTELYISLPSSLHTHRRDCPHSASTDTTFRTSATTRFLRTWQRRFCASHALHRLLPRCAASRTSQWVALVWVLPDLSSIPTSSRSISACATRALTSPKSSAA